MKKIVIFDWGGVIMHKYPDNNNDKDAVIRTIKSFNSDLSDSEAWDVYIKTLIDENGIYISRQNDTQSKIKWLERIKNLGNFEATLEEFENKFIEEHLKTDYYKEVVEYAHSLKNKCLIGLFSDLIYACYPALDKQVDLSKFDYIWLSYLTHLRKNTEEAFALVERDLQIPKENIMFIDDTTINIENAKNRGWNTCQAPGTEFEKIKNAIEDFLDNDSNSNYPKNNSEDKNMYHYAQKYFDSFIKNNFDLNNEKIMHKVKHTYHVVNNAKYICENMQLDAKDKDLAMVIALLHDIGRFDQAKEMNSFREDITNYDHASLGIKLLFEQNEIRNFIKTTKYDEIIKKAIGNHSKYILDESDMTAKEILHSKIIRDADKIDSFRAKTTDDIYTMANITEKDIEESKITDKVYNDFMNEKTILSKDRKNGLDMWISYIAFVFGLEFNSSLKLIKEKDYINKLFNRFNYKNDKDKMNILKEKANNYLNSKIEL